MLLRIGRDVGTFDCIFILILKRTDDSGLSFVISWLCQKSVPLWPVQCENGPGVPETQDYCDWIMFLLLLPQFCRRCCLKPSTSKESGGIWPLSCIFLSCYYYRNCCMQSTCTWRVLIDCITYQARSLHLDVVWVQPESNYCVEKIAVQNVSSFQQTRVSVTYFLQVWPI